MPSKVRYAVLVAFVVHGFFIVTARYRLSYDAYTHMLFANHYAQDWFSLWETRWYTGFTVVSYPPLTHQLIALFVPLLGFDKAFALILWIVTSLYPLGIYVFSRIFTGRTSASFAALGSAILLPVYVTAHIFGQLPFLTSTLTALVAAASFNRYLREGGAYNFSLSVALITTSMAMHHATLMVHPFLILAVLVNFLFSQPEGLPMPWLTLVKRSVAFGATSILTSLIVIFPFWQWGSSQTLQTPIDHLSRHNFFSDPLAFAIFFFPLYGPLVAVIPFLFRKWHARFIGLLISFTILFLMGLGGTTLLPKLFFGPAWEWLTYDRFAFWASLTLTPFFGILLIRLRYGWKNRFISSPIPVALRRNFRTALILSVFAITALGAWFTPLVFPIQPETISMQPIVDFLHKENDPQWRYVTFGFGDQFAYLNLLTQATTIDGSYHTARTLPELRKSGVGQVDTSYWALNGIALIKPILQRSGEHSVRWGFVNPKTLEAVNVRWGKVHRSPFMPLLNELGWKKIKTLDNGVIVYENPNALPPGNDPVPTFPPFTSFAWGMFPLLSLVTTVSLGALRVYPVHTEWVLRKVYSLVISLIPLALCFWLYRVAGDFSHSRVYFTYDNALFFISDALVVLAVILWVTVKIARGINWSVRLSPFHYFLFALVLFSALSSFWSRDWRTSLYLAMHLWLIFLLILSLQDWRDVWTPAMYGLCAALTIQMIVGFAEFSMQSTAFLNSLSLQWPGNLDPSMPGASVVELSNGLRILRVYGTLPHPNILGGFVLVTLLGPAGIFLSGKKPNYAALILLSLGLILLGLTFSRSAWLGLIIFVGLLLVKSKYLERKRLMLLVSTIALTVTLVMFPLRDFFSIRVLDQAVKTEQISTVGRSWLMQQALHVIRKSPIIGVGIGSFILELAETAKAGAPIEPVHNVFLLIAAELGIVGLLLFPGVCLSIGSTIINSKSPNVILGSAVVVGLGVVSLFDHYLWTLAPGRVLLGLAIGLWAGQVNYDA